MSIDPVCKMEVDERKAAAVSEYRGKKYYFCAVGCKKAFEQNPEKYMISMVLDLFGTVDYEYTN